MALDRPLVVTDLDGCLLDSETYSYEPARPALAELARAGAPLVLCSGKTRAEMAPLVRELALPFPYIVENGGAIVFPAGSFEGERPGSRVHGGERLLALAPPRAAVLETLGQLAREAGVSVRGFADMEPAELQRLTGLGADAAARALEREYDEPFLLEDAEARAALARAAAGRGLQLGHGGRFLHLKGGSDKGVAVRKLLALYAQAGRRYGSAGLGDAETDLPLLQAVDQPVVVPRRDGSLDPVLARALPAAARAEAPGPAGWNGAVLALLQGRALARVGRPARP